MKNVWRWTATLVWAGIIWYLTTLPDFQPSSNSSLSLLLSNGGHFFFFGVLAVLLPLASQVSLSITLLYGLGIELAQHSIPGRSFSLVDLALDGLGAFVFVYYMRKYKL